jgi:hypothetical protein
MRIHIEFDSNDLVDQPKVQRFYRAFAGSLLHIIGDLTEVPDVSDGDKTDGFAHDSTGVSTGTTAHSLAFAKAAQVPPMPPPITLHSFGFAEASQVPPPPPPPPPTGNVVIGNFPPPPPLPPPPPPPPPPPVNTAVPPPPPPPVNTVAGVPGAASVLTSSQPLNVSALEFDSAGTPWDARIHQKGKSVTKQGVWKLQKGIHEKQPGLVESVVKELASRMLHADLESRYGIVFTPPPPPSTSHVPPPPPPVSLPPGSMSVPPPPPAASVGMVPAPPPPPPVSVQGVSANGGEGDGPAAPSQFKLLIDRILGAKIAPTDVQRLCLFHGAPSLMELNKMQNLFPAVRESLDKLDAGIPLEMILNRQA